MKSKILLATLAILFLVGCQPRPKIDIKMPTQGPNPEVIRPSYGPNDPVPSP